MRFLERRGDLLHAEPGSAPERGQRFEQLFSEYSRPILAYALRRAEEPEDAADAVSEVFLVAWRRLDQVPGGEEARLWLFGVAHRVLANQVRSKARRARLGEGLRLEVSRQTSPDAAGVQDELQAVRAALRRLPERDREILRLVAWEGLGPSEAAKVVSISGPAARVRLHRARARLRRELAVMGQTAPSGASNRGQDPGGCSLLPQTEEES